MDLFLSHLLTHPLLSICFHIDVRMNVPTGKYECLKNAARLACDASLLSVKSIAVVMHRDERNKGLFLVYVFCERGFQPNSIALSLQIHATWKNIVNRKKSCSSIEDEREREGERRKQCTWATFTWQNFSVLCHYTFIIFHYIHYTIFLQVI